jgi:hypothetical protein
LGVWFRWQLDWEAVITDAIHKLIASGPVLSWAHWNLLNILHIFLLFPYHIQMFQMVLAYLGEKKLLSILFMRV